MEKEDIIFIILALFSILLIIWYIFGKSPSFEQVIIGLVLSNLGLSIKLYGNFQKHLGEHEAYRKESLEEKEKI